MSIIGDFGFMLGFDVNESSVKDVEKTVQGIKNTITKVLGVIGIGFSLTQMNALAEEFNGINDKINYAVKGLADQKEAQQQILKAANDCKTSYSDMAGIVTNLVKSNSELFPIEDAAVFSSSVSKLLITAGRGSSEISAVMEALNKSFQKGKVETDTINVLLERTPEAANLLADSLGVAKTQLLDMASEGAISVNQLKNAFVNAAGDIDADFQNLNFSISDAVLNMRNSWGYFLDDFNSTFLITQTIAKGIVKLSNVALGAANKIKTRLEWIADKIGGTNNLLKLTAIIAGSILLAMNGQKILTFFQNFGKAIKGVNVKMIAIVAVIVLIALLVEDFIAFMNGEGSMIGELLGKAGVDTDKLRDTIKNLGSKVKEVVGTALELGKAFGAKLLDAVKNLLPVLMEMLSGILPPIINFVKTLIPLLGQFVKALLPPLAKLITTIIPLLMRIIKAILPVVINLVKAILPLIGKIVEAVLPILLTLIETFLQLAGQIIETVLPIIIQLLETIIPIVSQIIEAVLPVLIELINTLLPPIIQIVETILPVILELIMALLPLAVQIVEAILPLILELITAILPVITPIIEMIGQLAQAFLPIIVSLLDAILPILNTALSVLKPIFDVVGGIINALSTVVGWVTSGLKWLVELFFGKSGSDTAKEVGNVDVEAEKKKHDEETSKTAAYAKGTNYSAETFIAGEEGPELITGQKGKKVFTAFETGKIFEALHMLQSPSAPSVSTLTNNSNSRTINQYNNFKSTFNGDRAGQTKSAGAMSNATDDAIETLARALAYTR